MDHFVITGTGRSGTRYAAELFTRLGLPCSHQRVFSDSYNLSGWKLGWDGKIGDSSAFAAPFVDTLPETTLIIHQVRDPRLVINSMIEHQHVPGQRAKSDKGLRFLERHVPRVMSIEGLPARAARFWTEWNLKIEKARDRSNYLFHRLEDYSPTFLEKIFDVFETPLDRAFAEGVLRVQSKTTGGTGKTLPVNIADIDDPEFHEMVTRYGYRKAST